MEDRKRKSVINRAMQLGVTSKKAAKKWSKEEEDIIREFYPKELNQTVLRLPSRSKVSVSSRARILGVRPTGESKIDWTPQEDEIIKQYYPQEGCSIVKRLENRTKNAIVNRASRIGIRKI